LAEALIEFKWALRSMDAAASGMSYDPHFQLTAGRLFDRLQLNYPFVETLPTANLPPIVVQHTPVQRFRAGENAWPLVQVGPGVLTVNETYGYDWEPFRDRSVAAIQSLFQAHPNPKELIPQSLALRYIDGIPFNYKHDNVFIFLQEKLKIGTAPPPALFSEHSVARAPGTFEWRASFSCDDPKGEIALSFATGTHLDAPAVIMDTILQSKVADLPLMPDGFADWLEAAHEITTDWFFKLIEGELHERFS
jgi:uncharacterized protein (TIGR04255 family)